MSKSEFLQLVKDHQAICETSDCEHKTEIAWPAFGQKLHRRWMQVSGGLWCFFASFDDDDDDDNKNNSNANNSDNVVIVIRPYMSSSYTLFLEQEIATT